MLARADMTQQLPARIHPRPLPSCGFCNVMENAGITYLESFDLVEIAKLNREGSQ